MASHTRRRRLDDSSAARGQASQSALRRHASRSSVRLGQTTVTYLPDGIGPHEPDSLYRGVDWDHHRGYLRGGRLMLSIGSFLIRTGKRKILVDLGVGNVDLELPGVAHLEGGALLKSLASEGLSPREIDTVVYTHLHCEHVGWTSGIAPDPNEPAKRSPAGLTFPRARHLVAATEWPTGQGPRRWVARILGQCSDRSSTSSTSSTKAARSHQE
jgi:glyoxylase-like metal-dependent hydrolase (beta-lactamase superfamily II)